MPTSAHDAADQRRPDGRRTVTALIEDAIARGIDTRVGLEDTVLLPDGTTAASNADLVRAARTLGAGHCAT